ncbi:MAG: hypothetical protein ABW252_03125, partial [Polyangiales bacterium]
MSDTREPVRWREMDGELPGDVLAGLRAYADAGPTSAERAQMRAALVAQLGTQGSRASVGAAPRSIASVVKRVGAALGLCTALVWAGSHLRVSEPPPAVMPAAPAATPPAPTAAALPDASGPSAREAIATPPPPAGLDAPTPAARRPVARGAHRARVPRAVADPDAELALLKRARRALAGAPAQALSLTDEHARVHAHGLFVQERELIAIEALVRAGRAREAGARGAQFRARFPGSAHRERLRVLLED